MTCDEVELFLVTGEALGAEAREHLGTCERCAVFQADAARVIQDAALPALTAGEKGALSGLAPRVHHAWKQKDRARSVVRRFVGLAVAACMGAAVASAALAPKLARLPQTTDSDVPEWSVPAPELAAAEPDDELDFEVAWPTADTN